VSLIAGLPGREFETLFDVDSRLFIQLYEEDKRFSSYS
jgi:hypothetical protein